MARLECKAVYYTVVNIIYESMHCRPVAGLYVNRYRTFSAFTLNERELQHVQ